MGRVSGPRYVVVPFCQGGLYGSAVSRNGGKRFVVLDADCASRREAAVKGVAVLSASVGASRALHVFLVSVLLILTLALMFSILIEMSVGHANRPLMVASSLGIGGMIQARFALNVARSASREVRREVCVADDGD